MTLNWRTIGTYDLPPMTPILFRFNITHRPKPIFVMGAIDINGHIAIDSNVFDRYDGMRCDRMIKENEVKSVYYIDPREILL